MKKRILFLLLVVSCLFSATAQTPGWTKMKSLNKDIATRYSSQMVTYNNKLYFLGGYGYGGGGYLNDFWEYDPETKTLNELSSLPPDLFPNAIAGGRMMVVIGDNLYYIGNQLREYNFKTKVWSAKANSPSSLSGAYVIGNMLYAESGLDNTFYSYDPTTNEWTKKASYPGKIRQNGFSFAISNKGYKGGGYSNNDSFPLEFYEYNPVSDTWAQKANMPSSLSFAVAISSNGKGYVGTGQLPPPFPYSTGTWYEYDPITNLWVTKASAPVVMESSVASINNDIYLFSGKVYTREAGIFSRNFISKYNSVTNTWTTDTAYAGGNRTYASGIHYNGKIYVTGGDDSEQRTDTWEYTIATNTWARKADVPGTGFSLNGQAIIGSKLFLVGGYRRSGSGTLPVYSNATLQYDAATNVWETKANYPGGSLGEIGAFTITGELYAGCGWSGSPNISSNAFYKYNAIANSWSALPNCPQSGPVYAAFSIGDIGYFVFGTSSSGTSIMYAYNRTTNTWSLKQPVPDFIVDGGSQAGSNNTFVRDGLVYMVGLNGTPGAGFSYSKIRKYDPVADKWTYVSETPFSKKGQTIVDTGNDIYIGFGQDQNLIQSSGTYYHVENDWYKFNLEADVSAYIGDKIYNCLGSQNLQPNQIKAFTDDEGKLFVSLQAGPTSLVSTMCITQRSLPSTSAFRENKIIADGNIPYSAMFMNKNFGVTSGGPSTGAKLRMYFTDTELAAFVGAFNAKYGSNKTINDIKIISGSNGSGSANLDPADNTNAYAVYTPTVNNYKTGNKYLEYTFLNGQGIVEGYAVLLINEQTLTFSSLSSKTYGSADFTPGATSNNSTIPITYSSNNTAIATITTDGKIHITGAGTTVITASQSGNANYNAAVPVSQTLTVTPAALTITADNKTKFYGSVNPALTVGYTGFVNGDDATKLNTQPAVITTATTSSEVNTYPITTSGAVSPNYTFVYTAGVLTVNRAPLSITADNKTKVQGTANPNLTVSYTGFVNSETSSVLSVQPSVSTTATSASVPGTYPITASGAAALNYNISYTAGILTVAPSAPVITSITPSTSAASATVTITGNYFTAASSVSFGGVPAASFTVISPASIIAVVGSGASGNVSVTTSIGTGTFSGYTFVPKPIVTAGGQTTFASGGNVVLTASPGTGYAYKWAKNGIDIAGATASSYTASESGSYTVSITINSVTLISVATTVNVIFTLPANNFKLTANGETCKTSNNGKISIAAIQSKSYTAVLTGNGLNLSRPFTSTLDFTDLQAGTYNVCITLTGEATYKQCFDLVITEPKDLSVYAVVKEGNKISLDLEGSNSYIIDLNGTVFRTDKEKLSLDLKPGNNTLKVSTGIICQGIFEKNIQVFDKPIIYPNPFVSVLNLSTLPLKTLVEIRSLQGRVVFRQHFDNESGTIALALESLDAGMYVLKTTTVKSESIYRIIKK
ncbi:Por secretion system C-terminal sorting domain-containing protein [Daejeonella rubra]|uniref:Por secretion system C-terminal sorting domain-containing protein n=1 Tax=Daejeonella rubra TaxID=990371 RepID=A0A1G9UEP3_9SPHI|nr:MBG domain-containing protein [Daejeonella rubra]SDM58421.1 Por secretion system C-terminal sorting domain-containing protein [Daejeonella rubra]